ncbi:MAG: divalent-cation tolerance protein CutA [Alphaproteobacteria bacterium]|nr:divalent-cation tolerance protein CutA [Alphaproteobacteria bacterium]
MILIYTTVETAQQAEHLAETLIQERLVACANSWPIQSMYKYKGKFIKSHEIGMYLKTSMERHDAVHKRLTELHPYECPAIIMINTEHVHPAFARWVKEQTDVAT